MQRQRHSSDSEEATRSGRLAVHSQLWEGQPSSYVFPAPATRRGPEVNEGPKGVHPLVGQTPITCSLSRLCSRKHSRLSDENTRLDREVTAVGAGAATLGHMGAEEGPERGLYVKRGRKRHYIPQGQTESVTLILFLRVLEWVGNCLLYPPMNLLFVVQCVCILVLCVCVNLTGNLTPWALMSSSVKWG